MTQLRTAWMALFVVLMMASPSLWAATRFNLAGALTYPLNERSTGDSSTGSTTTGELGYGAGASVEFRGKTRWGFELGTYYVQYNTLTTTEILDVSLGSTRTSVAKVHVPAQIRFRLTRLLTLGLGAYFDYSLESGFSHDNGIVLGMRFDIPMGKKLVLFLDGRYDYGMRGTGVDRNRGIVGLIGFAFGGGKGK